MSEETVSTPEATAQEPVADDPQQSIAAGMDAPSSERDPPVPVVTTGSGVTVRRTVWWRMLFHHTKPLTLQDVKKVKRE